MGFCLHLASAVHAGIFGKNAGETAFAFLKIPASAKSAVMGETFSAIDLDAQGVEYNPSAPAQMAGAEFWLSHLSYFAGVNLEAIQYSRKLGAGAMTFNLKYLWSKNSARDGLGNETGTFMVSNLLAGFGYAFSFYEVLDFGALFKYFNENLGEVSASAFAADIGTAYHLTLFPVTLSCSVQNLGPSGRFEQESFQLPMTMRFGVSSQFVSDLTLAMDGVQALDKNIEGRIGFDYKFTKTLFLRGGYKMMESGIESFDGASVGFGFRGRRAALDYAFVPAGSLDFTHRVTLGWLFGKTK